MKKLITSSANNGKRIPSINSVETNVHEASKDLMLKKEET